MTSLKGDLRSIMGTPFGGVGHAVLIFSRVTRAAFNSDSVVLQLHDRIEMPEEADGKFHVDGLDPGPIRIELEGGTVHNHGWNIDLPDEGVWSLTDLVDAQVDWSPAVIGRAEAAAREARDHADRAEAGADRVGTAEQVGVWASEASASASAAASAESGAITARNASQSARDAAEGHANRASTSESNAKTSETNAKQSETSAGDYAAVATTAATEAVDAMERATEIAGGDFATREYADSAAKNATAEVDERLKTRLVLGAPTGSGAWRVGTSESTYPWHQGLVLFDDFRTAGEVVDSVSFSGHRWGGNGSWISDGSVARAVGGGILGVDAGQSDVTLDAVFKISTVRTDSVQSYRIYAGNTSASGGTGVWATLSVSATGIASTTLSVTVGGTTRTLVGYTGLFSIGFTNDDPTVKTLSLRLNTSGTSVTLDLGGPDGDLTLTGDLTTQEAAGLSTWATVRAMTDHTPGLAIDEIGVETSPYAPQKDPVKLVSVDETGVVSENVLPERLSQDSLMNLIKSQQVSAAGGGLDMLATKLAFSGAGQHSIGVVSDSSMNDGNDSLRIFDRMLAERLPASVRHVYHNWNTADADWRHAVNNEGEMTPGHDGTVLIDTFSRVTSSLVGSVPDTGDAWSGTGVWSSDGQYARASGAGRLAIDAGDRSMRLDLDMQIALADAVDQRMDLVLGSPSATSVGGFMLSVSINSAGSLAFVPYVWDGRWISAGERIYGSSVGIPAASPTTHSVSLSIAIDIQNISIDVTGPSGTASTTAQMTELQYSSSGSWLIIEAIRADTSGIALDKVSLHTAPRGPQGDMLDVWNGAIAGAKLSSFDDARIESMFGGKNLDILMVSMGHNHRTQSPADFLDELKAWLDLWKQKHPETKYFIWVSQNPQFPPAASVMAHRERQHAVRVAHRDLGLDYVGGYEALSTQPDGGASLMLADGIHPTTPPGGVTEGEYGAVKVAEAIMDAVNARI